MHNALIRNATISAVLLTAFSSAAYAGDNNTITLEQQGLGNSLTVDQTLANESIVGGASLVDNMLSLTKTAQQIGSGNTAVLTITNSTDTSGGTIGLLQNNSSNTASGAGPNNATVTALDGGLALVSQIGGGNSANLSVTGLGAIGTIKQEGNNNNTDLAISGTGASGLIDQFGNNNELGLLVSGQGTNASYTLIGNNVSNATAGGTGVQVISNGATVTITQTPF